MLFKIMALYKKTVVQDQIQHTPQSSQAPPTKKRKSVKQKHVSFTETVYEPPKLSEKQRMYTQMFPGRSISYCVQ